jgi:hypothetical protein
VSAAEVPPPPLAVQLDALRAAFPGWDIVVARFGTDRWFEASRPGYHGSGPCVLVVATSMDMWRALRAAHDADRPAPST